VGNEGGSNSVLDAVEGKAYDAAGDGFLKEEGEEKKAETGRWVLFPKSFQQHPCPSDIARGSLALAGLQKAR